MTHSNQGSSGAPKADNRCLLCPVIILDGEVYCREHEQEVWATRGNAEHGGRFAEDWERLKARIQRGGRKPMMTHENDSSSGATNADDQFPESPVASDQTTGPMKPITTLETWMPEARQLAAQCWCDPKTSHLVMDTDLAESVALRIATWMDSAAMFSRNTDFYRGIVIEIGELFGVEAKTSDDGSIQEDVLALRVPELVKRHLSSHAPIAEGASGSPQIQQPIWVCTKCGTPVPFSLSVPERDESSSASGEGDAIEELFRIIQDLTPAASDLRNRAHKIALDALRGDARLPASAPDTQERNAGLSDTLPDESGLWWWWNEDEDSEPIPVNIAYSGSDGSYFAMVGQWGWNRAQDVKEMGGWWCPCVTPKVLGLVRYHEAPSDPEHSKSSDASSVSSPNPSAPAQEKVLPGQEGDVTLC